MRFHAGHAAVVIAERARLDRGLRHVVAVERVAFALVHAHVKLPRRLRIETARRGIPVHGVKFVGLDVAEQALARNFVGVVRRGEQRVALDAALQIKGRAPAGVEFRVVATDREPAQFLVEPIARTGRQHIAGTEAAQINLPLDNANSEQRAQLGQEGQRRRALHRAAADDKLRVARLHRRHEQIFRAPALEEDLDARLFFIEVIDLPTAEARLERQGRARRHRHALGIHQLDANLDGGATIGGGQFFRQAEANDSEAVGGDERDLHGAARVAEGIALRQHERVFAGLEIDADEIPDLKFFVRDFRAATDARGGQFRAVD